MKPSGRKGPPEHICAEKRLDDTAEVVVLLLGDSRIHPLYPPGVCFAAFELQQASVENSKQLVTQLDLLPHCEYLGLEASYTGVGAGLARFGHLHLNGDQPWSQGSKG